MNKRFLWVPALFTILYLVVKAGVFATVFGLNEKQAIAASILIVAAVLWVTEAVPLFLTSLIILFLQVSWLLPAIKPTAGKADRAVYLAPFFSEVIILFMGGFVLAAMLHKYGWDSRIAHWILKRTGTRPSIVMFGIMSVAALLSMWMSNTATTAMMFAIILPIIQEIPEGNKFSKALAVSIPFACNLGGLGTPIGTPPNAIAMSFLAKAGYHISFFDWMLATWPFLYIFMTVVWFILLKIYPPGDFVFNLPDQFEHKILAKHWVVLALFLSTIVGWLTTGIHGLSIGTVSLLPVVIAFGIGLLHLQDFKALPWDVLFMVGGGICLGVGLEQSGLTAAIVAAVPGGMPLIWILISFGVLASLMTTFMSNTATANLLIPLAVSMDGPVSLLVLTIALSCSTAMSLPVSTPPNAIAFGSGLLETKDMAIPGSIISIVALIVMLTLGVIYWPMILG